MNRIVFFLEGRGILIARNKFKYFPEFAKEVNESLLSESKGVLHIGAHEGQEAGVYGRFNLNVLWIEGDSSILPSLEKNILAFPRQRAINALLGDVSGREVDFYRSSNNGQSSSLFKFGKDISHSVETEEIYRLKLQRLDELLSIDEAKKYDHWVIDVQGAELLVLKGAGSLLNSCKWMSIEVSLAEIYSGGAKFQDLREYLSKFGLIPLWDPPQDFHGDVIFVRLG